MALRKRAAIGGRGLVLLGSISGGISFLVLWGDGAEIGRALLAGAAVAAWLVGFIAALNWYNKQRQQQVVDIIRQVPTDPGPEASATTAETTDTHSTADGPAAIQPRSNS